MSSRVTTKHLALLNDKLWDIHQSWVEFARALPVGDTVIDVIKADSLDMKGNRQKLVDVLVRWKKKGGTRTWKVIWDALLKIRRKDVADKIENEHSDLNTNVPFDDDGYVWTMMKTLEPVMRQWDQFALALELPNAVVLDIKGNTFSVNDCFTELIRKWINLKGEDATFDKVLTACERIGCGDLADHLRRKDKDIQSEFYGNNLASSMNDSAGQSFSASSIGSGAGLSTINFSALSAWSLKVIHKWKLTGQGTVVAILDTYVDLQCNEFFGKNYLTDIEVIDCLQPVPVLISPFQSVPVIGPFEHGTTCASIVVGSSNGIAPGAKLIAYRIAEKEEYYHEAALRALDDIKERIENGVCRIDVVSISCDLKEDVNSSLQKKITTLSEQYQVTFVAAAGNSGRFNAHSAIPARFDNVISVGALDRHGDKSLITSSGRVDVYAPGEDIPSPSSPGTFDSGTSLACPAIAGIVLLLKQLLAENQSVLINIIHRVDVLKYIFDEVMTIKADNQEDMVFSPLDFFQNIANGRVDLVALLKKKRFLS